MGQGTESCGGYEIEYDEYQEALSDRFWIQSDGSQIHVSKMSPKHLRNSIKLCERAKRNISFSCDEDKWDAWIEIFTDELHDRGELAFEIKAPAHYDDPSKVKATRGSKVELICHCGKKYAPRIADLKRGYGKSCCKRCASIKRTYGRQDPRCAITGVHYKKLI